MQHILVATDFSARSDRALRRGTLLAKPFGCDVALVHVIDDDQPRRMVEAERREATDIVEELAATVRDADGLRCTATVAVGEPFKRVSTVAPFRGDRTVSAAGIMKRWPATDRHSHRDVSRFISDTWLAARNLSDSLWKLPIHSHSMVPGGLDVTS